LAIVIASVSTIAGAVACDGAVATVSKMPLELAAWWGAVRAAGGAP